MTIPKEYNDGVLMIPWGTEVEAEIKARFGISKPQADSDVKDYAAYLEKAATVLQEHPAPITFERLQDYVDAHPRASEDGCRVVVNRWWLGTAGGEIGGGELIVGWGATLPFCNAIKRLIDEGTLQVVKPDRMLTVALDPANKPVLPGLIVTVLRGECPDGEPRD